MATKAPTAPLARREKLVTLGPQDPQSTPHIRPWPKVPKGTRGSQGHTESRAVGGYPETRAPQDPLAHLLEMKISGEASLEKWDPKASQEIRVPPRSSPDPLA